MPFHSRVILYVLCVSSTQIVCKAADSDRTDSEPYAAGIEFFEKSIRPVLVERCYKCHSQNSDKVEGGLLLDSRESTRRGGETGPAVVPKNIDESLLLEAIRYEGLEMPPDSRLSEKIVANFERWIEMGAPDPRSVTISAKSPGKVDIEAGKKFWAFQRPQRHESPTVKNSSWVRRPIDGFVLVKLEEAGLSPSASADRRTLVRRLYFDIVGLPPTPAEVDAFLADSSSAAYENLVDQLLDSPHYGERWARLWLDVSRYAEDQAHIVGNNKALFYPNAYLFRDWVIKSLNNDMPYDSFVRQQLASDLLPSSNNDKSNLAALGFIGLGPKYYRRNALDVMADEWEDRVDTVTRGLLGLTVACARCHDHKYDPIETEDYYALAGVFASTEMVNQSVDKAGSKGKADKGKKKDSPDNSVHVVRDKKSTDLNVFVRGDVKSKGPVVKRRFPRVLCDGEPEPFKQGSGRLELANAIANESNPLTARVIVNRIWGQYFGKALVGTSSNFGLRGDRPSHPQLLDDLSVRFMENGWSLKWLHKEIVLSATYQQTSDASEQHLTVDPPNRLLGRMSRRRRSIEAWRDAVLSATGRLDDSVGGKSMDPSKPDSTRRTVYSRISRFDLDPLLALFDFPDPNVHSARRSETTTPLQKLFVMNNPFMVKQAEMLATRLLSENGNSNMKDINRVQLAYELLFARPAGDEEVKLAMSFLTQPNSDRERLWQQYAQVLLASNEMLFID